MSASDKLKQIEVKEERVSGAQSVHLWRRASQYASIVLLVAIPLSGLFRIDTSAGAFRILDYQVWFADIAIVMGFWMMAVALLVFMYSWAGSVFCAWACPQNTVSEWANAMTVKFLGRRASMMDVSGQSMQVAARKDVWINKAVLMLSFLLVSMLYAMIPLLYFFPPDLIWSFITLQPLPGAESLLWIYTVCVLVVLINVAVLRHLVCKYMCIYRIWQHSFKTSDTLHIAYDKSREEDCVNCHYCEDSCFLDIDPRQTEVFDSCINCGECVAACDHLHAKSKKMQGVGLLRFAFGQREAGKGNLMSLVSRARAATVGAIIGGSFFVIGIMDYQPYHMVVDRASLMMGTTEYDFRIHLAHKRYQLGSIKLSVEGMPASSYRLEQEQVVWDSTGRKDILLHFSPSIKKGLHRVKVLAESMDGWKKDFTVFYYAPGVTGG